MADELGVEPMPETTALYRHIQRARARPRRHNQRLALAEEMDQVQQLIFLRLKLGGVMRELGGYEDAWRQIQHALQAASDALLVRLVLDGLTEMSRLLHDLDRAHQGAHLLGVVRRHPACNEETHQQADALFAEVASSLPADDLADAEERGSDVSSRRRRGRGGVRAG